MCMEQAVKDRRHFIVARRAAESGGRVRSASVDCEGNRVVITGRPIELGDDAIARQQQQLYFATGVYRRGLR